MKVKVATTLDCKQVRKHCSVSNEHVTLVCFLLESSLQSLLLFRLFCELKLQLLEKSENYFD